MPQLDTSGQGRQALSRRSTPYYPQIDLNCRRIDPTVIFRRNPTPTIACLHPIHQKTGDQARHGWLGKAFCA